MSDFENPWKLVNKKQVYANPWIQVEHHDVLNPAGNPGIYGVVKFQNLAIGIVPVDHQGYVYLVGQYRYPTNQYSWEIPEGGGPLGESPLDAASRELAEETGLSAANWTKLVDLQVSNSVTDELGIIFLATDLRSGEPDPEETEDLKIRRIPLVEAVELVLHGEITDSLSVCGLLAAELYIRRHPELLDSE